VLSSRNDAKHEERFAARLDVLMERLDTLASTVATTASAIAKKDGEIAALRRDLEARDQTLQALVAQVRQGEQSHAAASPTVDGNELRSLRNAVAALTKEHAAGGNTAQLEDLANRVRAISVRVEDLAAQVDSRGADRPSEELVGMLATLRSQVEALSGLRAGVTEERFEARFAETDVAVARLSQSIAALTSTVTSAVTGLDDKEHELAALHRHITESSSRIETVVEDIREAMSALPDPTSISMDDLAARVDDIAARVDDIAHAVEAGTGRIDRIEAAMREADTRDRGADELAGRLAAVDQRVAAVATELAHAKTLWPVALRSLEARLDDAIAHGRPPPAATAGAPSASDDSADDDLVASLRDSLHAMETVAAEMARASDVLGPNDDGDEVEQASASGGGATVVPLHASDP
jgi:chromosome segregation ATPase